MKSADGRFEYQDKDGDPLPDGSSLADVGRFAFICRSASGAQGSRCSINIRNAGYEIPQHNWSLTGTPDAPTISPSINCENCWHGFIEQGEFRNTSKQKESKQ
jgi:hypothetical protein